MIFGMVIYQAMKSIMGNKWDALILASVMWTFELAFIVVVVMEVLK